MAITVIVFNADTGSDDLCSGAPPNLGPLTGLSASVTNGSASIDLSADNPDLSSVPTDYTALIWLQSTAARNAYRIYSKNNVAKTLLVAPAVALPTGTYKWAIGGKRRTFEDANSRKLIETAAAGAICYTETDQTISNTLVVGTDLTTDSWFGGAPDGGKKRLTITTDNSVIQSTYGYGVVKNLIFRCTAPTKTIARATKNTGWTVVNCQAGEALDGSDSFYIGFSQPVQMIDCAVLKTVDLGITLIEGSGGGYIRNVFIWGCGSHGIRYAYNGWRLNNVIIANCNGHGLYNSYTSNSFAQVDHCIFYQNALSGIGVVMGSEALKISNSIFAYNGRYGIENLAGWNPYNMNQEYTGYNNFWANVSGARYNYPVLEGDISVDPQFADPANFDFRVGPNLRAKGWPRYDKKMGAEQTNTYTFVDIGAAQRKEPTPVSARRIFIPSMT